MSRKTLFTALMAVLFSCQMDKSLSGFIASNENEPGFKSFTVSSNALKLREEETDDEVRKTLSEISSIQLLVYSIEDRPADELSRKTNEVLEILKGKNYESMMEVTNEGQSFRLSARKSGGKFKEIILFGGGVESFFVGRIMGDLDEEKGLKLLQAIDFSQIGQGIVNF